MYARGMSVREIQGHLLEIYGMEASPDLDQRHHRHLGQSGPLHSHPRSALRHASMLLPFLNEQISGGFLLTGGGDVHWIMDAIRAQGAAWSFPSAKIVSTDARSIKPCSRGRHLVENFFCKLKEFERIATQSDKTDRSFAAMIYLTAAVINSR